MTAPARSFEFPTTVEALDVVEAGEVLEFVADWLSASGPPVAADLARHLDAASYPLAALIVDCRRLAATFGYDPDRR
jgi:hypothetical protein